MRLPIQALELARFATQGGARAQTRWLSIQPVGEHILQASATDGAVLAQFAWISVDPDKKEVCLDASEVLKAMKEATKKDRTLGAEYRDGTLQVGNTEQKPVKHATNGEANFPDVSQVIPEDVLDEDSQGPEGSRFAIDLGLFERVNKWITIVGGNHQVRMVTRGECDPIRIDVATSESGGRGVFVVMPSRLS